MSESSRTRFVVFTAEAGHKVAINPTHVRIVEPWQHGATIYMSGAGIGDEGLIRRVQTPFDEVMRSLRGEERPRPALD